jgi:ATP-dependent RNA helicase DeaD
LRTAHEFIPDPAFLSLSQEHVHVPTTEHVVYPAPDVGRERSLVRILEIENPASAIIFCNTKAHVQFLTVVLQRFGYDADALSADLDQPARERVMARVRQGALRLLVATDVAARGLDIPDLSHVIQYEAPEDPEGYIHRTGRTGRAGASGVAITLANRSERMALQRIASRYGIDMHERPLPTDDDVAAVVAERLTALLEARLRDRDRLHNERSRRFLPLARSLAENDDELSIIATLLDDYYQQILHAPVVQPEKPAKASGTRPPGDRRPYRRSRRRR